LLHHSLPASPEESVVSLAVLRKGARGKVSSVRDDGAALGDETGGTVVMRLIELGFVPGESFEVVGESMPLYALLLRPFLAGRRGDPMAVRIGGSCFALRRREAAAVIVSVEKP
jgi:ferrous iron transport protein A